jgi:hypothetical protein
MANIPKGNTPVQDDPKIVVGQLKSKRCKL